MRVRVLHAWERKEMVPHPYDVPEHNIYLEPGKEYEVAVHLPHGYTDAYGYHDKEGVILVRYDGTGSHLNYPWVFDMARFEWVDP